MAFDINGVSKTNAGAPLGSCDVFLFQYDSSGHTLTQRAYTTSNALTGAYTFVGLTDETSNYMVSFFKDGAPNVFDVTDHILGPPSGVVASDSYGTRQRIFGSGISEFTDYVGLTSTAGANAIVIAWAGDHTGNDPASPSTISMTYDPTGSPQSMTQVVIQGCAPNSSHILVGFWFLLNPVNKGNIPIRVSTTDFSGASNIIASSWSGVTTFSDAQSADVAPNSPLNLNFTSAPGRITMAAYSSRFNIFAPSTHFGTQRMAYEDDVTSVWLYDAPGNTPYIQLGLNGDAAAINCPIAGFSLS